MDRKLASVQVISNLEPIAGADKIEVASVLGWKLVVRKGEFKVHDKAVYIEIDSMVPEKKEFEFLRDRKFRIKTIKLRGQISQGICFPMSILPKGEYEIGQDVTEILGVKKYEPPEADENNTSTSSNLGKMRTKNFPSFIKKTDETRIQSVPEVIEELGSTECYITQKMDGCSFTAYVRNGEFGICSRNKELIYKEHTAFEKSWNWIKKKLGFRYDQSQNNVFCEVARKYKLKEKMLDSNTWGGAYYNFAIQGEICGPGIQGNKLGLEEVKLYVYNVYRIDSGTYLSYREFLDEVQQMHLDTVPILVDNFKFNADELKVEDLLQIAKGTYPNGTPMEGVVVRPMIEMYSKTLRGRLSFKIINNDFLLKYGE